VLVPELLFVLEPPLLLELLCVPELPLEVLMVTALCSPAACKFREGALLPVFCEPELLALLLTTKYMGADLNIDGAIGSDEAGCTYTPMFGVIVCVGLSVAPFLPVCPVDVCDPVFNT
jgi:hypothetical protein